MTTSTKADPTKHPSTAPVKAGLSPANGKVGAAVHHDLYQLRPDPEEARRKVRGQARVLGLAFFVVFTLFLGGVSFSLNGLWKKDLAASFPRLPNTPLPSESEEAAEAFKSQLPEVQAAGSQEWHPTELDLTHTDEDDLTDSEELAGLTPIHLYLEREQVATCYARLEEGQTPARLRLPNQEPAPVRTSPENAWAMAKLFHVLPTRYVAVAGVGLGFLALIIPSLLVPFYRWWMRCVAAPLGWFNTRLVLGLVWFLMFTPVALWLRLRRAFKPETDPLGRGERAGGESFWIERETPRDVKHYQRLF